MAKTTLQRIKCHFLSQFFLAYVFLFSGMLVTCLQVCMLPLWYVGNLGAYRRAISTLNFTYWTLVPTIAQWWSDLDLTMYASPHTISTFGRESCIPIMNHRGELDWVVSWIVADYANILGHAKSYVKNILKYIPVVGWSFWMSEYICVHRSFDKDKKIIDRRLKELSFYDEHFWLLIFCEGTRFTKKKHEKSMEFAKKNNLPLLKHHLLPRTKGFFITCNGLRSKVASIYDTTVAWRDDKEISLAEMVAGKSCSSSIIVRRIPMEHVPTDEKECSQFIHEIYREKDALCEFHLKNNRFPTVDEAKKLEIKYYDGVKCRKIAKQKRNLFVAVSWIFLASYFFFKIATYVFSSISILSLSLFVSGLAIIIGMFYLMLQAGKPQSSYGG